MIKKTPQVIVAFLLLSFLLRTMVTRFDASTGALISLVEKNRSIARGLFCSLTLTLYREMLLKKIHHAWHVFFGIKHGCAVSDTWLNK